MKKTIFVFVLLVLGCPNNFVYGMKRLLEPDQNDLRLQHFFNEKTFSEKWLFIRDLIYQGDITTLENLLQTTDSHTKNMLINHLNVIDKNLFHIAKERHSFSIALLLCDHGADAHSIPPTVHPLIQAAYDNDIVTVQTQLRINIHQPNDQIETNDFKAALLKERSNRAKALMVASYEGHTHVTQALLDEGTSVNILNSYGDSALMMACANGHTATAELLISNGADINTVNKDKETALMLAATNGNADIARLLLNNNASTCMINKDKKTALRLAQEQKRDAVVKLIIEEYEVPLAILALAKEAKQNKIIKPVVVDLAQQAPSKKQASKPSLRSTKRNNAAIVLINPKKPSSCTFPGCKKSYKNKYNLKVHIKNKHS